MGEVMELSGHPFYTAVQYHPEYISRPMRPSAPYLGLILASTGRLQTFLSTANQNAAGSSAVSSSSEKHDADDSEDEEIVDLVRNISFHGTPGVVVQPKSSSPVKTSFRIGSGGEAT